MTATHPTDHELGEFLLGKLEDSTDSGVENHLAECDSCRDRAVILRADDTFTELLAAARTRLDTQRASAPTPTLDGTATPPAFAPTLAWSPTPGADATGLAPDIPSALAGHAKYRPIRGLGTGGMGTVWLAEHRVMNRPVAIKVIRPDLLARPGATGRFLREVRAAAKLHHPNIVTAFDAEPAGDSCLLVMEYVPGETLGERLESGPLPMVEALRAVRDAARGLAHAHAHGLVHRDVKPHNLIRSADGSTKVLDFGLAGVAASEGIAAGGDGLTGAGMVVGTPDYIAPEQITNPHAADARADIYGLGCTLYHLLVGRPPTPDGSVTEKLTAQRTRPMDPIPGLPAAVAAVLAKMTAKDPAERYQSADEVVAALDRCIRMVDPVRRRKRRQFTAVAAGLLAVGLLATAGVVLKIQRDNQEITVATNDDDIEVVMKRKGEVLRVVDKKTGKEWVIDTAKNEIAQADAPDGLTVKLPESEPFVLRRNGKDVFSVTRTAKATAPAVAKPNVTPPVAPRLVRTIEEERRFPQTPLFTPDGKALLVAGYDYFAMDDPATGKELFSDKFGRAATYTHLAVSADSRTAAVACGDVFLYDLSARKRVATIPGPEVDGKQMAVSALTLSPDGQKLAYVADREVIYYDRSTGQTEHTRPDDDKVRVFALRYSPDGRQLAMASYVRADMTDTRISLLDAKTRALVGRHQTESLTGATLQFSPDGRQLFVAGRDILRRTFWVLVVAGAKEVERESDLPAGPEAPVPSPDGHLLALTRGDGTVQVWDRGQKRVTFAWNPHTHTPPEFEPPPGRKAAPPRTGIAFSSDGRTLATARGNEIRIWDLAAGPATPGPGVAPRVEFDKLQGTWNSMPLGAVHTRVTIQGTHFTLRRIPKGVDPHVEEPKPELFGEMLDVTTGDPPARFQIEDSKVSTPLVAIYRLEADTLFLCLRKGEKGHEFPTKFATNPATRDELLVLKKAAVTADPRPTPEEEVILKDVERRIDPASTDGKNLPFALLERNGVAAIRFSKWLVVFEAVPCDSRGKVLFGVGAFFLPETGGRGNFVDPGLKRPAPPLRQQSTVRGNMIAIERYEFHLESKGTRLKFADQTYEATDKVQTIVIARDGTTRLEPAPKK